MSKNRPVIPPPRVTYPTPSSAENTGAALAAQAQAQAAANVAPAPSTATTISLVKAPPRTGSVRVLPDRIEFTNPTIERVEHIWLKPRTPEQRQERLFTPDRAFVAHGLVVIEEMGLSFPVDGTVIRI